MQLRPSLPTVGCSVQTPLGCPPNVHCACQNQRRLPVGILQELLLLLMQLLYVCYGQIVALDGRGGSGS